MNKIGFSPLDFAKKYGDSVALALLNQLTFEDLRSENAGLASAFLGERPDSED